MGKGVLSVMPPATPLIWGEIRTSGSLFIKRYCSPRQEAGEIGHPER